MMRSALVIVSVFCIATLLSQALGVAFLYYRGQLSPDALNDIRLVLSGQSQDAFSDDDDTAKVRPSSEDIVRERSMRILELTRREEELALLKTMISQEADQLIARQKVFAEQQKQFEERLKELSEQTLSAASEQSRGILQAMPPSDAVDSLMQLELDEAVMLLREMPEKNVAKLLQEFLTPPRDAQPGPGELKRVERGREIFEAITRGEPTNSILESASQQFGRQPATQTK